MKELKIKIWNLCKEIVENSGFLLIDLVIRGDNKSRIIEVFVDGLKSVDADVCADLSRKIDTQIEAEEIFKSKYRLDVSSPGTSRSLKYFEQFPKHLNRKFNVEFYFNSERKKINAKLVSAENDMLSFESGNEKFFIEMDNIIKANVIVSF